MHIHSPPLLLLRSLTTLLLRSLATLLVRSLARIAGYIPGVAGITNASTSGGNVVVEHGSGQYTFSVIDN